MLGINVAPQTWAEREPIWSIWTANADPARLAHHVDLSETVHAETTLAAAWACNVEAYLHALAAGVPFHAFRYDDLNDRREASVARLLAACGCAADLAPHVMAAYARDSQAGTAVARDRQPCGFDAEQWQRVRDVLRRYPHLAAVHASLDDATTAPTES